MGTSDWAAEILRNLKEETPAAPIPNTRSFPNDKRWEWKDRVLTNRVSGQSFNANQAVWDEDMQCFEFADGMPHIRTYLNEIDFVESFEKPTPRAPEMRQVEHQRTPPHSPPQQQLVKPQSPPLEPPQQQLTKQPRKSKDTGMTPERYEALKKLQESSSQWECYEAIGKQCGDPPPSEPVPRVDPQPTPEEWNVFNEEYERRKRKLMTPEEISRNEAQARQARAMDKLFDELIIPLIIVIGLLVALVTGVSLPSRGQL